MGTRSEPHAFPKSLAVSIACMYKEAGGSLPFHHPPLNQRCGFLSSIMMATVAAAAAALAELGSTPLGMVLRRSRQDFLCVGQSFCWHAVPQ